ncbi:MAG: HD domain-containing protein [Clostridium sp.]
MNRIGIIEIGVDIFNLTLSEVDELGYFKIIDQIHSSVALSTSLLDSTKLSEEELNVTISTLKSFKSMCQVSGVTKIIAVATEAFREATNSCLLADLIKDLLSIDIRILSVAEEIKFNFLAVSNSIYFDNSLLVDIEGCSTHISWVKDGTIKESVSLPTGYLNLTSTYNLEDVISLDNLEQATCENLLPLEDFSWLKENEFDSLISSDIVVRSLGRIDRIKKRYPLDVAHNYRLHSDDVTHYFNLFKTKDLKSRKLIDGIKPREAKIIVAGSLILKNILDISNIDTIVSSSNGLSGGLMYNYILENFDIKENMLDYSISSLMDKLNVNKPHANQVYFIAKKLFNELKPLHKLSSEFDKVLKTAALLHDCGTSIDYYNHHRHSFYIILNSELKGLSHKEMLMSAAIAASHRNNSFKLSLAPYSSILNKTDIKHIEYLGTILKIAEGLDRSLEGAVRDLSVIINSDKVSIYLNSRLDLEFEINQAMRSSKHFFEIYKKQLFIQKF